ncbi:MAG: hypothetical protein R3Y53_05625 [Bacillota bacterium]
MFPEIQNKSLSTIEVYGIAWRCLKAKYKDLIKILLVIYVPIAILDSLITLYLFSDMTTILNLTVAENAVIDDEYMNIFSNLIQNQFLIFLISVALSIVGRVAVNHLTYDYVRSKEGVMTITSRAAISYTFSSYIPLVTTGILRVFLVILGYFCFIFPGVYLEMMFVFFPMAVAFRGKKMKEALLYSKHLLRGNVYRLILAGLIFYTITVTFSFLLPAVEGGTTFIALYTTQFLYSLFAFISVIFWDIIATILFLNFEATTLKIDVFPEIEN